MDVVSVIASVLGDSIPTSSGDEIRFCCQFCDTKSFLGTPDTKYHLYVNPVKGVYFCQRCKSSGRVDRLLNRYGLSIEPTASQWEGVIKRMKPLSGEDFSLDYDPEEEAEYPCETYAVERGYQSYRYLVGSKNEFVNGHRCRGLSESQIDMYRFRVGTKRWAERIFIPVYSKNPQVPVFWQARYFGSDPSAPKYLSPAGRRRKYHLFNYENARRFSSMIVTEGIFSAIAAGPNAVATFGKYISTPQLSMILNSESKTVFVALDGDAIESAIYAAIWLSSRGKEVRVVELPPDEDPDSVDNFGELIRDSKLFDFKTRIELVIRKSEICL